MKKIQRINDRQQAILIVSEAVKHPARYAADRRDMLADLLKYSGRSNADLLTMGLSTLPRVAAKDVDVTAGLISRIVEKNPFNLPEVIAIPNDGEPHIIVTKDFLYDSFGYVDPKNETKIQERIEEVFQQNKADSTRFTGASLIEALIRASGWSGSGTKSEEVSTKDLSNALDYDDSSLWRSLKADKLSPAELSKLTNREMLASGRGNVLHLYNGDEEEYLKRVDAIYEKFGRTHWRPEKLHANAAKVIAQIRQDPSRWPLHRAASELLPDDYKDREAIGELMVKALGEGREFVNPMTPSRAVGLLNGNIRLGDSEGNALIEVIAEKTGLGPADRKLLETLDRSQKRNGNEDFSHKLGEMLEAYFPAYTAEGKFVLRASCRAFAPLTSRDPEFWEPLATGTLENIVRNNQGVGQQSARAIVTGFEALKASCPHQADKLTRDIGELLEAAHLSRQQLFKNANEIVRDFDETHPWPVSNPKTRIGTLLDELRCADGLDVTIRKMTELSGTDGNPLHAVEMYLTKNQSPVTVKERSRNPELVDNLDRIVGGIQKGLKQHEQEMLTPDSVAKIRRIAIMSHDEVTRDKTQIIAANAKRSRQGARGE